MRHAHEFVTAQLGPEGWCSVLERLSAQDREVVEGAISVGWYELALQHRLFVALDEVLQEGTLAGLEAFAKSVAERDLTRVHRLFLRFANPAVVLEKSGEYWSRFYDAGSWRVVRTANGAFGELSGIREVHPIFCRFITGYISRMFQLVGVLKAQCVHSRCMCRGAPACLFEGEFSD